VSNDLIFYLFSRSKVEHGGRRVGKQFYSLYRRPEIG